MARTEWHFSMTPRSIGSVSRQITASTLATLSSSSVTRTLGFDIGYGTGGSEAVRLAEAAVIAPHRRLDQTGAAVARLAREQVAAEARMHAGRRRAGARGAARRRIAAGCREVAG